MSLLSDVESIGNSTKAAKSGLLATTAPVTTPNPPTVQSELSALGVTIRAGLAAISHAASDMLVHAFVVGEALNRAKELLKRGDWEGWVTAESGLSLRTARDYMRLASHRTHSAAGMGVVKKRVHAIGEVSLSALEDQWQRDATAAAIEAARGVVQMDGPIPPGTPIGRLSDTEWGWVLAAMLFAWIGKRAEQAAAEQLDTERTIRLTALDPQPWDAGAVAAILPELADACADIVDWSKPLAQWPRETIIEFLLMAMPLIRKAMIARDLSNEGVTRKSSASTIARQANAAAGGPLMTLDEFNDEIGI